MATTITEIRNLTKNTTIDPTKLIGFDSQEMFSDTITNDKATKKDWTSFATNTDNIQVTWKDGEKVIARAVGGRIKIEGKTGEGNGIITISDLMDVSGLSLGLNGQIEIAPKESTDPTPTAVISVRVGNINERRDWLIDLSDKKDGAPGTSVRLDSLVAWAQGQTGDTTDVALPSTGEDDPANKPALKDFTVEFNQLHFNITQKTFDIDVSSKKGDEIKFGNFTIKNVGFRLTNETVEISEKTKELPEDKKEEAK